MLSLLANESTAFVQIAPLEKTSPTFHATTQSQVIFTLTLQRVRKTMLKVNMVKEVGLIFLCVHRVMFQGFLKFLMRRLKKL